MGLYSAEENADHQEECLSMYLTLAMSLIPLGVQIENVFKYFPDYLFASWILQPAFAYAQGILSTYFHTAL